jgi:hypothetical protein
MASNYGNSKKQATMKNGGNKYSLSNCPVSLASTKADSETKSVNKYSLSNSSK